MFTYNNTHIFTGYLKKLLSSFNLPTCKVYTSEFTNYFQNNNREDPRIIRSFDTIVKAPETLASELTDYRLASRINYLKDNCVCNLLLNHETSASVWMQNSTVTFDRDTSIPGLTKTLYSPGNSYDTKTHEYLGDFLRFLRDYYNLNLMSLYNCFTNKLYSNIYIYENNTTFDSNDSKYKIYALPVKLFAEYTIAIECNQGIELFCGLYKTTLDTSAHGRDLFNRTYQKINSTSFSKPFIYDKLKVDYWPTEDSRTLLTKNKISRCDIACREQDLKLFIKVPTSCKSSIVILEGDYRNYNDSIYKPKLIDTISKQDNWSYNANHTVINFDNNENLNKQDFKPISKLQLLALNTTESYPFADRLVEYLSGSAITSVDGIPDNTKRVQKVMNDNRYYFKIEGLWENKIQKIAYAYMNNVGPIERLDISKEDVNNKTINTDKTGVKKYYYPVNLESSENHNAKYLCPIKNSIRTDGGSVLIDRGRGLQPRVGYRSKSTMYDVLGYIDKDVEKYYASWKLQSNGVPAPAENIQNADIYNKLFDI